MRFIKLATDLNVPLDAVTQRIAFLARPGAGKTYAASVLAEGMLDAGAQVVAFDPVGVWWGLRLLANGKPGFNIPVFGGNHGDFPLEPGSGATLAKFIAERRFPAVIDLSTMRKGARKTLVTDFAEEFFLAKKRATEKTPVHLIFDEAQAFVPQKPQRDEARMLGAFEDIIGQGRNHGIGITLISQRPQALNKSCLNLTEMLCVLQMNGKHELDAIEAWIREKGIAVKVDGLPKLGVGEAVIWSPSWLKVFRQVTIAKKQTFDASATPEVGKTVKHGAVELDDKTANEIKSALKETIAKAEQTDPRALQRRVAELEQQLKSESGKNGAVSVSIPNRTGGTHNLMPPPRVEIITKEVPVFGKREQARLDKALATIAEARNTIDKLQSEAGQIGQTLVSVLGALKDLNSLTGKLNFAGKPWIERPGSVKFTKTGPIKTIVDTRSVGGAVKVYNDNGNGNGKLKKGALDMLAAIQANQPITRDQIGVLSGISPTSGTFSTYLGHLKAGGYVEENGGRFSMGPESDKTVPPMLDHSTDALLERWSRRLKAGARRMLGVMVESREAMNRAELGERSEIESSSGTFSTYLGHLKRNALVIERDGRLTANSVFHGVTMGGDTT